MKIIDRVADEMIEAREPLRRRIRRIPADEPPQNGLVLGMAGADEIEKQREADRQLLRGRISAMDVPDGIAEPLLGALLGVSREEGKILIDILGNDIEVEALAGTRRLIHEKLKAFRTRVAQPLVDGQAVALRLRNLLSMLVEEQLVIEALRRLAAEHPADAPRKLHAVDVILARHLVINAERRPAHAPSAFH